MKHGSWRRLFVARFTLISSINLSPVWVLFAVVLIFSSPALCTAQLLNSGTADPLAQSALALLLGDLQQEIVNGSTPLTPNNSPAVYLSTTNTYMVPVRNGVPVSWSTTGLANTTLLRISGTGGIPFPGIDQTASNALSTGTSANGRSIGPALWNQHYLIQLQNSNTPSDTTPDINFIAPSWVYLTGTGSPAVLTTPTNSVVGRYAYAIYDEGALLDVNVAGFPCDPTICGIRPSTSGVMPPPYVSKGSIAFADLTALTSATAPIQPGVNDLVGWRNYASMQPGGIFPYLTFTGTSVPLIYRNLITTNTNGFLLPGGVAPLNGQGDQLFGSRQALINLVQAIGATNFNPNALQYLGTFSRAVTAPSWKPTATIGSPAGNTIDYAGQSETSGTVNRDLANVRFATSGAVTHWTDGVVSRSGAMLAPPTSGTYTVASGDPLLQSRFSLAKIAWLSQTWAGEPDPGTTSPSYAGSVYPAAIQACFGLKWGVVGAANGGNACWSYVGSPAGPGGTLQAFNGTIETLDQVAAEGREPNFFELLKAAILNGSIGQFPGTAAFQNGNPSVSGYGVWNGSSAADQGSDNLYAYSFGYPAGSPMAPARVSDIQIMQIGANIIDQFDADNYPTAIYFNYGLPNANDAAQPGNEIYGPTDMVYGQANLPALMSMFIINATVDGLPTGAVTGLNLPWFQNSSNPNYVAPSAPTQGISQWWQPQLWNPNQMPNPANSSVPPPSKFQIRGYGKINCFWNVPYVVTGYTSGSASQFESVSGNSPAQQLDGANPQIINFIYASATNNTVFYDHPTQLTQNLTNVTVTTSSTNMLANSKITEAYTPNPALSNTINPFVGFWAGTDPTYPGTDYSWVNVESQILGAVTFTLGWTDSNGGFHPYSFLPGIFTHSTFVDMNYGAYQTKTKYNPYNGQYQLDPSLDAGAVGELHHYADPRTIRFSSLYRWGNWRPDMTLFSNNGVPGLGFGHMTDCYGWGHPNGLALPPTINPTKFMWVTSGASYYDEDFEVNSPTPPASSSATATYYSDPDGVVRPGDGQYGNAMTGDGMLLFSGTLVSPPDTYPTLNGYGAPTGPTGFKFASGDNGITELTADVRHGRRPVILNRPFRSVGELGYAFRDLPFKSLDFFSSASADAALLDVFSVTDEARVANNQLDSVVAGQVNLNNAPVPVIQAILAGASKKDYDPTYNIASESGTLAQIIASQLNANPITNRAGLVTRLTGAGGPGTLRAGFSSSPDQGNKAYLEAPIRALADSVNTRTWNLMVDLIAQSGTFTQNATDLDANFVVQGETHYWLHVAIDRYTGQIVDESLEQATDGLTLNPGTVTDNQPAGTTVGTLSANGLTSPLTFMLVSGSGSDDNASFAILGNTLITANVLQYLTKNSYSIRVRVTDQNGLILEQPFTVIVQPGPYTQWKFAKFQGNDNNPAIAGDTANPSGDGLPNLLKYALGLNPLKPTNTGIAATTSTGVMTLNYTRGSNATDVTVQAWWSSDLTTWSTSGVTQTLLSDNGTIQTWQATAPLNPQAPKMFMQLQVTEP